MTDQTVAIVTCTGDRPEALAMCRGYVERQDYCGATQWVVVDDGDVPTFGIARRGSRSVVYERLASGSPAPASYCANLLVALEWAGDNGSEWVVFMEDDDFYSPEHVRRLLSHASEGVHLIGDPMRRHYHLPTRQAQAFTCSHTASLAQTAIHRELIPDLLAILRRGKLNVDATLWRKTPSKRKIFVSEWTQVGIKGLPGRPGIGVGHRPDGPRWDPDPELQTLGWWVGSAVETYERFACTPVH